MPYIKREDRKINNPLKVTLGKGAATWQGSIRLAIPGELNFAMTMLASEYVRRRGVSYTVLNEVVGVFASAMAEFQRRVVAPYENKKRAENGEVYDAVLLLKAPKEPDCLDSLLTNIPKETDHAEPD